MKKITLLFFILCVGMTTLSYAQCTSFSGGGPYNNFNTNFGGAPCDDGTGCPFNEISTFEMWADESYLMDNVVTGHTYTFSACNGPGAGSWPISFTIIAPSGVIDAFGLDAGSTCALTWTATESGTYEIGVSEAGIPCDTSSNQTTNNGFPAITCSAGSTCATCTETAAPSAATMPTPADMAIDIPIDISDPANPVITPFSWVDGTLGGVVESYNLSLGITPAGNDIGTLTNATNGNGIVFNWQPATTYYWTLEAVNCFGSTQGPVWSFMTAGCTPTAAPDVVSTPTPANMATDIPIDITNPASFLITPFSWVEAATGAPAESFTINLGVTSAGNDIGSIPGFANGNGINFAWEYDTTYFWSIDAVNCFGTTPGPVWSFTTEEDPTLSLEGNKLENFKIHPNPTSGLLNIDTSLEIDSIRVINLLGQEVSTFNRDSISNNSVNLSELPQGLYMVTITAGDKSETFKINKK